MKQKILALAMAVSALFAFSACEIDGLDELIDTNSILGKVQVTTSNGEAGVTYVDGTTLRFNSSLCNAVITDTSLYTMVLATERDLVDNNEYELSYPLIGMKLFDTVAGVYNINHTMSYEFLISVDWKHLLTANDTVGNMFVMAVDEDGFYFGMNGSIELSEYNGMGTLVKGNINNLRAVYMSRSRMTALDNRRTVILDSIEILRTDSLAIAQQVEQLRTDSAAVAAQAATLQAHADSLQNNPDPTNPAWVDDVNNTAAQLATLQATADSLMAQAQVLADQANALAAAANRLAEEANSFIDSLSTYFPAITLNGTITSRRANISSIIESIPTFDN